MTLDTIQSRIAAYADEDPVTGNISDEDYALRLNFVNQAITEWQEATNWKVLYTEYNTLTSTATGNLSIALPTNFRKLASYPIIAGEALPETNPIHSSQFAETEKRIEVLGNPATGYNLRVYGTALISGASIKIPYYAAANALASPADISEIPDSNYLVKRSLAYMLESRDDAKFVEMKGEADRILGNMIDRENVHSVAADESTVKSVLQTKYGYRIGGW